MQNSSKFKTSIKESIPVSTSFLRKGERKPKITLMTPIMLAAAASTALMVLKTRLMVTRRFVGFIPAEIDRDPEIMNISGPQAGAAKINEMAGSR